MRRFLVAGLLLAASGAAFAQKPCSKQDAANAEKSIERVVAFGALYRAWQDHRHCEAQAPVNDAFADALLRLLVAWRGMDEFAAAVQKDAGYKAFVMKHVASDAAKDDRDAIFSRAKNNCPGSLKEFCAELGEAVKPAKGAATPAADPLRDLAKPLPKLGQ